MVCTLFWALSFKSTLVWSPTPGKRHILSWELTTWGNFIVPVAWQLLLQIFSTLLAIFTFLSNFFFLPNYFIHSLLVFKYLPWPFSCFIYCFAIDLLHHIGGMDNEKVDIGMLSWAECFNSSFPFCLDIALTDTILQWDWQGHAFRLLGRSKFKLIRPLTDRHRALSLHIILIMGKFWVSCSWPLPGKKSLLRKWKT